MVPAASGPEQLVVNGMSPSNRGSKWSNSGMVVELHPEDLGDSSLLSMIEDYVKVKPSEEAEQIMGCLKNLPKCVNPREGGGGLATHPLSVLLFQDALERQSWIAGNMKQTAPAQRMSDFVNRRLSADLPSSSYVAGLIASPLHFWMPKFITERLKMGFLQFGKMSHGFLTNEATMIGVETRTSSPVRIVRDNESLQHIRVQGLFPCGEGAGYAGGIVSAGVDGERCAERLAEYIYQIK